MAQVGIAISQSRACWVLEPDADIRDAAGDFVLPEGMTSFAGHPFVFGNRRRDRVKILYWDRDGFAVWAKRLEQGTYAMPFGDNGDVRREITAQELGALLRGIDLSWAAEALPKKHRRCRINTDVSATFFTSHWERFR